MKRLRGRSKSMGAAVGVALIAGVGVVHATGSDVVATVGKHEIKVSEVKKHLANVPPFQLKNMGDDKDAIRKKFVDELVEMELMVQGARRQNLGELPEVRERLRAVLVSSLLDELALEAAAAGAISDEKVRAYYDANSERYLPQERILIWQIEVKTKAEAEKLLETIKSGPEFSDEATFVEAWEKLTRENSIDKSTYMRKGNIGFVSPDGSTHHKDIRVPKAIFEAAATIEDGQVYPQPLQVETSWLVIARRGSSKSPHRTLESEAKTIRGILAREHVLARRKDLVDRLRDAYVHEKNERVLDQLTISESEITVSRRPGALRQGRAPRGSMKPVGKPGSLR